MAQVQVKEENKSLVIKKKFNNEQIRERDHEVVRGRFKFDEIPGGTLSFFFHKYKGDKDVTYHLIDGKDYEIPRMVAQHLARTGTYVRHEYQLDNYGRPMVSIGRKKTRYSFIPTTFIDDFNEDVKTEESKLYTVEKVLKV